MTEDTNAKGAVPSDEREVRFSVSSGLALEVTSASGDLHVRVSDEEAGLVRLCTSDPDPSRRLALVACVYDAASNRLVVDTKASRVGVEDTSAGLKSVLSRWFNSVHHDVDVEVVVPSATSVRYRTASGGLTADGALAGVDVSSASGDVTVGTVTGALKLNSASGDVRAERAAGATTVKTASGDVSIGLAAGDLSVQNVSGDVTVTFDAPVDVEINTVSGDVAIGVREGLLLDLDAKSLTGDLSSEIALDGEAGDRGERALSVKARSVSGDVAVRRASLSA